MTIDRYIRYMTKDFCALCGALTLVATVFASFSKYEILRTAQLWQIILISLTLTLFKYAFINTYELEEMAQKYSFFICSLLADTTLLILLFFFSPGRLYDMTLFFAYLAVVLLIKALVYYMMQVNGREQAKQINLKLIEYKKEEKNMIKS